MTLDEAIEYHERIDKIETRACSLIPQEDGDYESHKRWAFEHRKLAEWLKDYKRLLGQEPCEDCISRQAAIEAMGEQPLNWTDTSEEIAEEQMRQTHIKVLKELSSVKPTQVESMWIPIKYHEATKEEIEENGYAFDVCYIIDNLMPYDDQEILVTVKSGKLCHVEKDTCYVDDGFSLDSGYDWITDVIAWMPLPEPYKAESEG